MITLSKNSARGGHFLNLYRVAFKTTLSECYANCSGAKTAAFIMYREWCKKENGKRFRIISHNTMTFTCAWTLPDGSVRVETVHNTYLVK